MRHLHLLVPLLLSGCVRNTLPHPAHHPEDESIRFPSFREGIALQVGGPDNLSSLDGVTLRAISVAANDFVPPDSKERLCWQKLEAHRFKVIRQEDIVFVEASLVPGQCMLGPGLLDHGATYAIRTDGRILRRVYGLELVGTFTPPAPGAAEQATAPAQKRSVPRAELELQDVRYDGETLSGQLQIGAVGGRLRLDKRLIENIHVEVNVVRECATGLPATYARIHGFHRPARQEDILILEPGTRHGTPVHFGLFNERIGYPGPDCIDTTLSLHALDGSLAGSVSVRAERATPSQHP